MLIAPTKNRRLPCADQPRLRRAVPQEKRRLQLEIRKIISLELTDDPLAAAGGTRLAEGRDFVRNLAPRAEVADAAMAGGQPRHGLREAAAVIAMHGGSSGQFAVEGDERNPLAPDRPEQRMLFRKAARQEDDAVNSGREQVLERLELLLLRPLGRGDDEPPAVPFGVRQGRRGQFGVKKRSDVADDHADHAAAPRAQTPCRRRRAVTQLFGDFDDPPPGLRPQAFGQRLPVQHQRHGRGIDPGLLCNIGQRRPFSFRFHGDLLFLCSSIRPVPQSSGVIHSTCRRCSGRSAQSAASCWPAGSAAPGSGPEAGRPSPPPAHRDSD